MTVFRTERLRARPWTRDDAAGAFEMYGDPEVVRHIGGQLQESVESTATWLDEILARSMPVGMGSFPLLVESTGELVGTALIKPLPDADNRRTEDIEVGWHLARRYWGNGYATEAGRGLLRHGFLELDLEVLHAVVVPENTPSHAVAQRLSMEDVGLTEAYYGRELRHYVMQRERWRALG